ncbi:hypothetical protein PT2222_130317 [Paraburkholderia tropica]
MNKGPSDSRLAEHGIHETVTVLVKHHGRNSTNGIDHKFFHYIPPAIRVCYSFLFILDGGTRKL